MSLSQALTFGPAAVSGYEVPIVVMAVVALVVLGVSSLAGLLARFSRGRVDEADEMRHRSPEG